MGCMPVLPAFFRSMIDRGSASQSSKSGDESFIKSLGSKVTMFVTTGSSTGGSDDRSPRSREYNELSNMEHGRSRPSIDREGTTTTIEGGCREPFVLGGMIKSLNDNPQTNALVSTSVQVESHPRVMEQHHDMPQAAYIRR